MSDKTAFTYRIPHTAKNAIIIDVEICFKIPFAEPEKTVSVKAKALVDTGANGSCVSKRLASACRLVPVSAMRISSAQGLSIVPVYELAVHLPNGSVFHNLPVMEVMGSNNFDVIIGMDILTKSDFAVSNVQNELVFTMRVPPKNVAIDFLTQHD